MKLTYLHILCLRSPKSDTTWWTRNCDEFGTFAIIALCSSSFGYRWGCCLPSIGCWWTQFGWIIMRNHRLQCICETFWSEEDLSYITCTSHSDPCSPCGWSTLSSRRNCWISSEYVWQFYRVHGRMWSRMCRFGGELWQDAFAFKFEGGYLNCLDLNVWNK